MKILLTGSSGLIGSSLIPYLERAHHTVYKLVRKQNNLNASELFWDPEQNLIPKSALEKFDVVIHLAGEPIFGLWTQSKKERIQSSRVHSTDLLAKTLNQLAHPPSLFISASGTGYYGLDSTQLFTEESPKGKGFLADVCSEWEQATRPAVERGIRTINIRLGVVLSKNGGMFKRSLIPFKMGLGGRFGDGKQYMSWIVIDDLLRIIDNLIMQTKFAGPINAVSPFFVTNQEWVDTLGKLLNRPTFCTIPSSVLKFVFGDLADEILLNGSKIEPKKLLESNFEFTYPSLTSALSHLLTIPHS